MIRTLTCVAGASLLVSPALGVVNVLEDRNSTTFIEDGAGAGMFGWEVDGTPNLAFQGFFYRTGGMGFESAVDTSTLALTGSFLVDTNPFVDPRPDTFSAQYTGPGFVIEPTWTLRGGMAGSGTSDIAESIAIHNTSNQVLQFTFFQYSDFDLGGTSGDDSLVLTGTPINTAKQSDPLAGVLNETVVTPSPQRYQVDDFPNLIIELTDTGITNLNNNAGPLGPGDMTWAFQWEFNLLPGQTALISKDKQLNIPAPSGAVLLGIAGLLAGRRRRA